MTDGFEGMRGLYGDWCFGQTPEHTSEPGRNVPVGNNGDGQNHGETSMSKCGDATSPIAWYLPNAPFSIGAVILHTEREKYRGTPYWDKAQAMWPVPLYENHKDSTYISIHHYPIVSL